MRARTWVRTHACVRAATRPVSVRTRIIHPTTDATVGLPVGQWAMRIAALPVTVLLLISSACGRPAARIVSGDDAPEAFVGQSRLQEIYSERDGYLVSPILAAPRLASRVAVWLATATDASDLAVDLEVRGYDDDGSAGPWQKVDVRWREGVQRVGRVELGRLVDAVELRFPSSQHERVAGLVWSAIVPDPGEGADALARARADTDRDARASEAVDLDFAGPGHALQALEIGGIEPRSAWNARASTGCSANTNKDWITVHHSVSALQVNGSRADHAAAVRGIQAYHMDGRGYCDAGYHFAATADGTVWEAREARFLGAHTGSHNTNNAGIVFIGCFHPVSDCNGLGGTTPPDVMLQAGGAAIGRIAAHYGIAINTNNVIGHRDNPDQSTSCPGDGLHTKLGQLRSIAAGGGTPVAGTGKLQGVVWDLSVTTDASQSEATGARRPGATLSVTGGGTTTARAGDSYWSFDLAPGTYTVTASLAGYAPASREVQIAQGADVWASIGIAPQASAVELTIHVVDAASGAAIDNATVGVTGADPAQSDAQGDVVFNLGAGDVTITASAEGYLEKVMTQSLAAGAALRIDVELEAIEVIDEPADPEGDGDGEPLAPTDVERVTILPPTEASGGCSAGGAGSTLGVAALALLGRRRRVARI